jgi:hypothetical protein
MFVGHYAAALVLRPLKASPSLPVLFAAVQLMDILFFSFVLAGVEAFRITPGITVMNPLDLYHMPFSHGLGGVLIQSALFGLLIAALMGDGSRLAGGLIATMAVFSHWVLDVITHQPDMMLLREVDKIGAGLWNFPAAAMLVETLVITTALIFYLVAARPSRGTALWAAILMVVLMVGVQAINWFGPAPNPLTMHISSIAAQGLLAYGLLIAAAVWVERTREH